MEPPKKESKVEPLERNINDLSSEILVKIFSHLPADKTVFKALRVCKLWNRLITENSSRVTRFSVFFVEIYGPENRHSKFIT